MLPKVEYEALAGACATLKSFFESASPDNDLTQEDRDMSIKELDVPRSLPEDYEANEEFLKKVCSIPAVNPRISNLLFQVHAALVGYEIIDGELRCPDTERTFPIRDSIPNMLVDAEEVGPAEKS